MLPLTGKKTKRRFRDWFHSKSSDPRSTSTCERNSDQPESAPVSASQCIVVQEGSTSAIVTPTAIQSNIKDGLGIAGRFTQTLLKKLPDCIDSNPVKMALSIIKTIIIVKDVRAL